MKKFLSVLVFLVFGFSFSQTDCELCVEQGGFYCGDDESNWTQYAPEGCVIADWINDGWEDCVDATDENGAEPTTIADCSPYIVDCDTIYIEIPVIEYIEVFVTDTIIEYEEVIITEYLDCDTGMPCNTGIEEIIEKSKNDNLIYNLKGQAIREREGLYIQNGKVYFKLSQ